MIRQGLEHLARLARGVRPLLLLEARCAACGRVAQAPSGRASALCTDCHAALAPPEGAACPGCGQLPKLPQLLPALCANCLLSPHPWGRLVAWGAYEGPLRDLILGYKFEARLDFGRQLQECLLAAFERGVAGFPELKECEMIVPVPLHPRRLAWRGFNQSRELARLVAERHGLPIRQEALVRVRRTVPQMELDRAERAENIRGAFAARAELLAGRRVLLVDDIMTTGSTLEECARMMLCAGAAKVHVLLLATA